MLTPVLTALLAILVFVLTQTFLKIVLEPIQEQRKLIGEVAMALTVYQKALSLRVDSNDPRTAGSPTLFGATLEESKEAQRALRELAGRLRASLWSVPLYDVCALVRMVPKLQDVVVAADELQMWYSQLYAPVNEHQLARIRESQATISKRLGIERRLQAMRPPSNSPDGGD